MDKIQVLHFLHTIGILEEALKTKKRTLKKMHHSFSKDFLINILKSFKVINLYVDNIDENG
jgi:hypothetical protein